MIEYVFHISNEDRFSFKIDINREFSEHPIRPNLKEWALLDYHKCPICALPSGSHRICPTAFDLQDIIDFFSPLFSHERVIVKVSTPERDYQKECDIQTGLQSVVGLVMATSACPILSKLKPLAKFHLPFSTTENTLFRTVGAYLIQQYYLMTEGKTPDFELERLQAFYADLEILNRSFSDRVRNASQNDANLCALVELGAISFMVRMSLKDQLRSLRNSFFTFPSDISIHI